MYVLFHSCNYKILLNSALFCTIDFFKTYYLLSFHLTIIIITFYIGNTILAICTRH